MTDDLRARLEEDQRIIEGATEGPWEADTYMTKPRRVIDIESGGLKTEPSKLYGSLSIIPSDGVYGEFDGHDAAFIAHARTGYPAALRALQAVLELHRREVRTARMRYYCARCGDSAGWPCPTVRAITEHLGATP